MAASELTSDAAIRFKLGRRATDLIENRFKHGRKTPGPLSLNWLSDGSVARRPSLNRMAASDVKSDAAIRCSFAGNIPEIKGYTTAANEHLRSVFETERQMFSIESAGHVGLTPLRKPLLECLFQHSNPIGDPS
ncbi:hypothetical protein PCANC_05964 [Puccinia coronata f. sp. avenae]|uniref:Uncharacterized protein n=1 Tax=Puccinia coronata f. sp. avenae TaxID=200324 RepID=A0A2N5V1J1_9BASI|nr:hypothetical protein PCASD_05822 [Puccinia coronata f. sp. avenae]PLW53445.1 hypothetical protein PCANC_05964 [Puccinia coronata f. sp. avenae]